MLPLGYTKERKFIAREAPQEFISEKGQSIYHLSVMNSSFLYKASNLQSR